MKLFNLFILFTLVFYACAPGSVIIDKEAMDKIYWPGPPESPRIKYQWSLSIISGRESGGLYKLVMGEEGDFTDPQNSPRLLRPYSIYVDGETLYIADTGAFRVTVIDLKNFRARNITNAGNAEFVSPVGIVAFEGMTYVSDSALKKVFIFDREGRLSGEFQGSFQRPTSLAIDRKRGIIYVSDTVAHVINRFDLAGADLGSIGRNGSGEGEFNFPTHLWVDDQGRLYVTDEMNFRIQIFSPAGDFAGMFGAAGDAPQNFERPKGIATDSDGNVYVADSIKDTIKIFSREGELLLLFGQEGRSYGDFYLPSGIFINANDNIYVADTYNGRVQVFQYLKKK
ncbi:MAG: 6-bladed beta-propeller [Nitrospirae bacterium]|nr:6-bladed beta-propeller [Nitrospirota bacterium]